MATDEGNVDPELVKRVDAEVFELTGVGLDELLNPSKVVNYEREVILLEQQVRYSPPPHLVCTGKRSFVGLGSRKVYTCSSCIVLFGCFTRPMPACADC